MRDFPKTLGFTYNADMSDERGAAWDKGSTRVWIGKAVVVIYVNGDTVARLTGAPATTPKCVTALLNEIA